MLVPPQLSIFSRFFLITSLTERTVLVTAERKERKNTKEIVKKKKKTQELPNKNDRAGNLYSAPKLEQLTR